MTAAAIIIARAKEAEFRASGTDLSERRRSGVSRGPLIDITPTPDMTGIAWGATGAARIGASTSIAAIAADARLAAGYPGIACRGGGFGDAADPPFGHDWRQSRPTLAVLVLPQPAH
jgi:xanthine dehydrogenase YagS FAD-binding subunit